MKSTKEIERSIAAYLTLDAVCELMTDTIDKAIQMKDDLETVQQLIHEHDGPFDALDIQMVKEKALGLHDLLQTF